MHKKTRTIVYKDGYGDAHRVTGYDDPAEAVKNEWNTDDETSDGYLGVISAKNSRGVRYWAIVPAYLGTNTDKKGAESADYWWQDSFDDNVVLALRHKLSVTESEAGRHWTLALSMGHIPNKAIDRAWGAARRTYNKAKEAGKLPGPQNAYHRFMGDKALYAQDEEHKHLSDLMPWEEGGMQDASEPLESAIEAIPFGFFSDEK